MFENMDRTLIMQCAFDRWSPKIGDPSFAGWLTVAAYGFCAVLAVLVVVRIHSPRRRVRMFWALLAILMAFLTVNKQLDLQSFLTAIGRCVAKTQGWYEDRRSFQRHFIFGLLAVTILGAAAAFYAMRRDLRQNGLAILGLVFVAGFVAVRAVGFHHVDAGINQRIFTVRVNVLLELAGLVLIAVNAIVLLARPRRRAP